MTTGHVSCGSILRLPVGDVATRCAEAIVGYSTERAVCMDPQGRVSVESVSDGADPDLVGVYSPRQGLLALHKAIREDLQHDAVERGLRPNRKAA